MARNGSGVHTTPNTFTSGTTISSSDHNENFDDLSDEITNSVAADGQTTITGAIKFANGTAAAPALTFASDTDTGAYRSGANEWAVAAEGVQKFVVGTASALFTTDLRVQGALVASATSSFIGPVVGTANFSGAIVASATATFIAGLIASATSTFASKVVVTSGGLTVSAGGFTLSAGAVSLPAASVAAAALAVPSGVVLISHQSASSSATIDFTSGLGDTYDFFEIVLSNIKPATDDANLILRVGTGGGPTYQTSGYGWNNIGIVVATPSNGGSTSDSSISLTQGAATNGVGSATGENYTGIIRFANPEAADFCNFSYQACYNRAADGKPFSLSGNGNYLTAGAITGVRIMFSTGNIASGTIALYGRVKA